jgi:hypothetical protein
VKSFGCESREHKLRSLNLGSARRVRRLNVNSWRGRINCEAEVKSEEVKSTLVTCLVTCCPALGRFHCAVNAECVHTGARQTLRSHTHGR